MRMFTTYLIATFLFGLCLLENELRKKASKLETSNKSYTELSRTSSEGTVNQNFLIKSKFRYQNSFTSDNELNQVPSARFIAADSTDMLRTY